VVIGFSAVRDDSATFTRPTDGIAEMVSTTITWAGNHVEFPATHLSTTTGNDFAADAGYRMISAASGTATGLQQKMTLSAVETLNSGFIMQGVTAGGGAPAAVPSNRRARMVQLLAH
jgi:hypothetical protein